MQVALTKTIQIAGFKLQIHSINPFINENRDLNSNKRT